MHTTKLLFSFTLVSALFSLACADKAWREDAGEDGDSGIVFEGTAEGDEGPGAMDPGGGPVKLDAPADESGMADAGDAGHDPGCQFVDLLFVIDNSGSMDDEQANLVGSFPGFIHEIQTQLADADSYHVGVITTDEYEFNDGCDDEGAMVIATGGSDSSKAVCGPYADGYSYMTENDELETAFSCAAKVGTDGDGDERPMQTMQAALSEDMIEPGGCNEGFLRDDALLVIVIITDEEDDHEEDVCTNNAYQGSSGGPAQWFDEVVAAKGGVEQNIVVLSLVGPPGPDPESCPLLDKCVNGSDGAEVAERIVAFTTMFTNGFVGQICAPSYETFFAEAVGVISAACENFVPIG
ncbi:hypothetical protein DB30_05387 [Enhygromyxa salina]|uniref:VWFA domain-containing protein n=1 Tax=Enhygromyxa salina TaxID=215803 RepID=A0A0C1ZD86_9BACT|nr:hypothetical protein [Enhygromyxa salina]KIG15639.1 hypothetical protein DB30_05387 [Enhygromyxa salina]